MLAEQYEKIADQREHVLRRPGMYVGGISMTSYKDWIYNFETNLFENVLITFLPAVERVYLEILSNAADNARRTRNEGRNPGSIEIFMDDETISIKNYGNIIPVVKHPKYPEYWVPEMLFGELLTSSNYNDDINRIGVGLNGLGAKLVNIFSSIFIVKVGDKENKTIFTGLWENNMSEEPTIEIGKFSKKSFVEIIWNLDFARFGIESYPEKSKELFLRHAIDFSFTCQVPIIFNGVSYEAQNIKNYIKYIFPEEICETAKIQVTDDITVCLLDTPDNKVVRSFANGMITKENGVHVSSVYDDLGEKIKKLFKHQILLKDIKPHISMIVSVSVPNPEYPSQEKSKLAGPAITVNLKPKIFKGMESWNLIQRVQHGVEARLFRDLKKTDATKKRKRMINMGKKGEDANKAGTKESHECELAIPEGLSATSYPKVRRTLGRGKDYVGYYAIKGVPLNVTNASHDQLKENREFADLKIMIGLQEQTDYKLPENKKSLRYGKIIIYADADSDGLHIKGLLVNFFYKRFPSLIELGMVKYLYIPMIKVTKNEKIVDRFYSDYEYRLNAHKYTSKDYEIKYFKGLATSDDPDIEDDLTHALEVTMCMDDFTEDSLDLAFDKNLANERKLWIEENRNTRSIITPTGKGEADQYISDFINSEMVVFSTDNLFRAIPCVYDGFKDSQKKLFWEALNQWLSKNNHQMKVSHFAAKTAAKTKYLHGEVSLSKTVINMTQSFVGTCNLPYFKAKGQFGTRDDGGTDEAPDARYPNIILNDWCSLVYFRDLIDLVPRKEFENSLIENEWIPAIIPMVLVNGANGIATGSSTNIPNYNPKDLVEYLLNKCRGKPTKTPLPYYEGFTGVVKVTDSGHYSEEEDLEKESETVNKGRTLRTFGTYSIELTETGNRIEITELPVGRWFKTYKTWLFNQKERGFLEDFYDGSTHSIPYYVLTDFKPEKGKINHTSLRLVKSSGINLTLIDIDGRPIRFDSVDEIIDLYFEKMSELFLELKRQKIASFEEKIEKIEKKLSLIELIINSEINSDEDLERLGIDKKEFYTVKFHDKFPKNIEKKIDEIEKLKNEIEQEKKVSPLEYWIERLLELKRIL